MNNKLRWAAGLSVALLFSVVGVAFADDISNNLDGTIDATAETMSLKAAGPDGTAQLFIRPANGDGKNGCNLQGTEEQVVVKLTSGDAGVATVSPSSVTFKDCNDTRTVTVHPVAEGSAHITASIDSANTYVDKGTFTASGVNFDVTVGPKDPDPTPVNQAPRVSLSGVTDGAAYEIGSVPAATCEVMDDEDGPSSFLADLSPISGALSGYGLGSQTASCSVTDAGGLTAGASATYEIVDTTAPVITFVGRTPAANIHGWNKTDVTATWSCSDSGSGVVASSVSDAVSTEGASQTATGVCTDRAGNEAKDSLSDISIDKSAPLVSLAGGPADGGSYYWGSISAPTCDASDALSGLDGICALTGYSAAIGPHTVTATATDNAGNTSSDSHAYTVKAWELKGFYSPVDMNGVVNTVKGGSTVPLKFEVFAGSERTDTSAVSSIKSAEYTCTSAPTDELEATATGGTSLRYDTTAGQFIYNWQTPKTAGKCYRLTMTTQDGSSLVALFKTK
jgi:hypothetical protein